MSDRLNEQLSALLDGELSAGESELLLRRLERDAELRQALGRYALIGDAVRVSRLEAGALQTPLASTAFASRISAAIEAEAQRAAAVAAGQGIPVHAAPVRTAPARRRQVRRWLQPLGGVALAAGVAGLALMVVQRPPVGAESAPTMASVAASPEGAAVPGPRTALSAPVASPVATPVMIAPSPVAAPLPGYAGLASGEPDSYTTPLVTGGPAPTFIPPAELASYVVAHSEVSGPLARRNVLSGVVVEPAPARP